MWPVISVIHGRVDQAQSSGATIMEESLKEHGPSRCRHGRRGLDVQMSGVSGGYLPFLEDDFPFLEAEGDFPFCFLAALTFLRSRLASLTSFLFA